MLLAEFSIDQSVEERIGSRIEADLKRALIERKSTRLYISLVEHNKKKKDQLKFPFSKIERRISKKGWTAEIVGFSIV